MAEHQKTNIRWLLHDIQSSRECPPQPSLSGAKLPGDSEETHWFEGHSKEIQQSDLCIGATPGGSFEMEHGALKMEELCDTEETDMSASSEMMKVGRDLKMEHGIYMKEPEALELELEETDAVIPPMPGSINENTSVHNLDLFYSHMQKKDNDDAYKKMQKFRQRLPSYADRQKIVNIIEENQVVVLSGETGCGKTTQVPQYILDDYIERKKASECRVICTQPRRISAITVAERVAAERAEKCGDSVGYMIRLENTLPRTEGSILYCTTGVVLKILESDTLLKQASHIILDEIHERDILSDFLIIVMKDILQKRPDLKLILMSATLNAESFSKYFGNCPMINIPGFTYPVEEFLLEDVIEQLKYRIPNNSVRPGQKGWRKRNEEADEEQQYRDAWLRNLDSENRYSGYTLETLRKLDMTKIDMELVRDLIKFIDTRRGDGAILVFLPGWGEISNVNKLLTDDMFFKSSKHLIIPLHSMMPTINQRQVFEKPPSGVRKIILATNIAETSITIDDVVFVIDGGRIKVKGFTPETNLATLKNEMVSRANARQRRGRAGRVRAGECYHLYTSLQESMMLDYLPPEILRTRLEEVCLRIKFLKLGEILPFVEKAMQPPSLTAVRSAIVNLQKLNALDHEENLLPLGKHLARMPLDPHTGKMILFGAIFGCLDPILTIAACLNFKDPFYSPLGEERRVDQAKQRLADGCQSDHLLIVKAFERWVKARQRGTSRSFCYDHFMSESTLVMLQKMRQQLADHLNELGFLKSRSVTDANANRNSDNPELVKAIVCAGLYPNVAQISKFPTKRRPMILHTNNERCELHPKSVATDIRRDQNTQWVVFHHKMKTNSVMIYDCSLVSPYSILFFGGDIKQIKENNVDAACVDDWIKFKASPQTVSLVQELKTELQYILDRKITNSRDTDWHQTSQEETVIKAIIDLVTTDGPSNITERPGSTFRRSYRDSY